MQITNTQTCQYKANSILLIEEDFSHDSPFKKSLTESGYRVCECLSSANNVIEKIKQLKPELLLLNITQPDQKTLHDLALINQLSPLTVIIFAKKDCPTSMQASIKAGVSSYVVNEIQPHRLTSIISVAKQRFVEYQMLRSELEQTKTQLLTRKLVERAKGLIMQQKNISEQEAYANLRKMAMDNSQSLAAVSQNVIKVCELLTVNHKH